MFYNSYNDEEKLDDLKEAIIEDGGPDTLQGLCDYIASDLSEFGRAFIVTDYSSWVKM